MSPGEPAFRAATVSRVLNNIGTVKSSTRSRVLKAIEDLKYYPNAHAQALAGGASRTLGLIVSNLENPFFLDIFRVLEQEAHSHGYEVLIANTDYDSHWLNSSVRIMLGRRVAGLALIVSEIDPAILDELESRAVRTRRLRCRRAAAGYPKHQSELQERDRTCSRISAESRAQKIRVCRTPYHVRPLRRSYENVYRSHGPVLACGSIHHRG